MFNSIFPACFKLTFHANTTRFPFFFFFFFFAVFRSCMKMHYVMLPSISILRWDLKEYSAILKHLFHGMIKRYNNNKSCFKISVDPNFIFTRYAWFCALLHRQLCWIIFHWLRPTWKLLKCHTNMTEMISV